MYIKNKLLKLWLLTNIRELWTCRCRNENSHASILREASSVPSSLAALHLAVSSDVALTEIMLRIPVCVLWFSASGTGTDCPVYICFVMVISFYINIEHFNSCMHIRIYPRAFLNHLIFATYLSNNMPHPLYNHKLPNFQITSKRSLWLCDGSWWSELECYKDTRWSERVQVMVGNG